MYKLLAHHSQSQVHDCPETGSSNPNIPPEFLREAVFAGESFWNLEAAYGRVDGVVKTVTGYCGGSLRKPTYRENFGISTHQRSAIFYSTEEERRKAQESKIRRQMKLNRRIVTKVIASDSADFFTAENQHQKYYLQKYYRLCECLGLRSTEQFSESNIACALNGILAMDGGLVIGRLAKFIETRELLKKTRLAIEEVIVEDLS
ncbi:peptide methionine sulfoxide reductase A5-like isoform X2 [Rhododendron vialii]|uniref:peptide methionine sulfoxide reductase A5-like isoform X2 n=1 Tax=Rhododendron vialii TaxID=182163 RepID=UPI002660230F|nr:peptide methionine sulfoxide reductase A5-like isoform X2 [Rhododendron vialii]